MRESNEKNVSVVNNFYHIFTPTMSPINNKSYYASLTTKQIPNTLRVY